MPGMIELHAHLILLGHGNYGQWFPWIAKQGPAMLTTVMEISAKQLLEAGVTSAVDLGAPLAREPRRPRPDQQRARSPVRACR